MIGGAIRAGLADIFRLGAEDEEAQRRTDRDLSMGLVLGGSVLLIGLLAAFAESRPGAARYGPDRRRTGGHVRFSVRHRLVAADGRDRLVVESDFGHDRRDVAADLPDLSVAGEDGQHGHAAGV